MSILKAALARETVQRDHEVAVSKDRKAEREVVVAAIHKVFLPEVPDLEKLSLKGDYGRPATVPEAQSKRTLESAVKARVAMFGAVYCTPYGLELHLGGRISPESLCLVVDERTDQKPLSARLSVERQHPYKTEILATFHGHTDPTEMVERFFEALAKYVHDAKTA